MQSVPPTPPGLREIDFGHYVRHYTALLWRWKWWIMLSTPITAGIALVVFLKLSDSNPELSATALIGMEPIVGMIETNGQMPQAPETSSQAELIRSRIFLQNIANMLSLRLSVSGIPRSMVFDSVFVDSVAPSSRYTFDIDNRNKQNYTLLRKTGLFSTEQIARGKLANLSSFSLPGVFVHFNRAFLNDPRSFSFSIAHIRGATEYLYNSLSITTPKTRERNPSFTISVIGTDARLITTIVNTIADKYVEKNLSLRQARTKSVMEILEKQLAKAKSVLEISESQLRIFQSANPTTGLSQIMAQSVIDLSEIERGRAATNADMTQARALQAKLTSATGKEVFETTHEVLLFLNARGNTSSQILGAQISRLLGERPILVEMYNTNHPKLTENQAELNTITEKTIAELSSYIQNGETRQREQKAGIAALSNKMHTLPAKELQLAKLIRQQQVNADIYSRILDKYNQSKVSDVVEVSDVYVMDYAVIPVPPPADPKKLLGICLALCMGIVFGPMLLFDMLAKSVRTEQELKRLLPFDILESIPSIARKRTAIKEAERIDNKKKRPNDKLISNEFSSKQEYIKELFRSLRTKILLGLQLEPDKSLVVTSLEAGAGKSTISANIAIAIAQQNKKTILIDGDLRLGTIHQLFAIEKSLGLSEFLASELPVSDLFVMPIVHQTEIPNLFIIPSGRYAENAAELISSERFSELKRFLSKKFEFVLCDSPPIGVAADAISLSSTFARYILVVRAGKTNVVDLKKKIKEYPAMSSKLLGIILNYAAPDSKLSYYKHSKYYT